MLVVADSSPLIALVLIEHINVLPKLFGKIVVREVAAELADPKRTKEVREWFAKPPTWLVERSPSAVEQIPLLHAGELAAISLARELGADLLLIDELAGRRAAADRKIPFTGTIGVLELAANQSLLDLREAFARLKTTNFWIAPELLDERLALYLASRRQS